MPRVKTLGVAVFSVFCALAASPLDVFGAKDQSRISPNAAVPPAGTVTPSPGAGTAAPDDIPYDDIPYDDWRLEDLPAINPVDLDLALAKRAVDAFAALNNRYNDQNIAQYETLEEFVAKTEAGKKLEAEIQTFGFRDITQWNNTITMVSITYSAIIYDQATEIRDQINQVQKDGKLDKKTKTEMLARLRNMIPTEKNSAVVKQLIKEPGYEKKLHLLADQE